jgi:hypothetical protein
MRTVKAVCVVVLGGSVLLTAACGSGGGSAKPAAQSTVSAPGTSTPAAAGSSSTAPAAAGAALTTDQLKAALLADADVPGYTADPGSDSADVKTGQDKVATGGAACQMFMDATNALVPSYGTVAEVDHSWLDTAQELNVQLALYSFPSADKAKKVLADTKAGLADCKSLTAGTGTSAGTMALSPLADIGVGDSSSTFASTMVISGTTIVVAVTVVQVGSTAFNVAVGGPGLTQSGVAGKMADLKSYAVKEAAKLKAAQHG